jgi:hypothetical protein
MTGDADAAFGPDGSLYVLNLAFQNPPDQPTNPTVLLYRRPTGSRAWHGPATFPAPHGTDQPDRPWLAPDPHRPKRIFVTNSEGVGDVVMWTSTDRGHSFSGPTLITGSAHPADIVLTSRPLFDPARRDRMFMVYEASAVAQAETLAADARDFPLTQLWLARSDDGGRTWTNHLALDITAAFGPDATSGSLGHMIPASAIDESGNLYAAFSLRMGGAATQTHIYLLHSSDRGGHWSGPVRVDPRHLRSNVMPALAVGAPGRVDLSWYGSRNPDFTAPHARWAEQFAQSRNALSARPTFTRSRVSRGGPVHVGSIDSAGNPGSSQYDWDLRDFQGITIDGRGLAHIVWTNDGGRGATVAARQVSGPSLRCSPTGESLVPVR